MNQCDLKRTNVRNKILKEHIDLLSKLEGSIQTLDKEQYKTLSKEQEQALFWGLEAVRYSIREKVSCPTTYGNWESLLVRTKNVLALCNEGLVHYVVRKLLSNVREDMYDDCVSEGTMGLIDAIELFDVRLGYRLCTFAFWKIKGPVIAFLKSQNTLSQEQLETFFCNLNQLETDSDEEPFSEEEAPAIECCGLSLDTLQALKHVFPNIVAKAYSNKMRRALFAEIRTRYGNWSKLSPGLRIASKTRQLDAFGEAVGKDRKQAGAVVGEYSVPISELLQKAIQCGNDKTEREEASVKLKLYLSAVARAVMHQYQQAALADSFTSYLITSLNHAKAASFPDALPTLTAEFLASNEVRPSKHECWHWPPDRLSSCDDEISSRSTKPCNERGSSDRKFLQQNTPVRCVIKKSEDFKGEPVTIGKSKARKINPWPANWEEVFECKAEDFNSLEDAHAFSFALGFDPGDWPVPEPSQATVEILIAAMNTVHYCVAPSLAGDRVPLNPSVFADEAKIIEFVEDDQYWANVYELALNLLRAGLLSQTLSKFGIFRYVDRNEDHSLQ